jgi:transcription elongation factor Elf1
MRHQEERAMAHQTIEQMIHDIDCSQCGNHNTYEISEVDEPVTVGNNTVLVPIKIAECRICHDRLMDTPTADKLVLTARLLKQGNMQGHK